MNIKKFHYQLVLFPIFLLIVVFILWASLMKIGAFVRAQGKIVPSGNVKQVQHLEGGILSEILVKTGDQVRAGQVMFRIRNEFAISNLAELQVTMYSKLSSEARLRAELNQADSIQFPAELLNKVPNIVDNEKKLFSQRVSNRNSGIKVLEDQAEQRKLQLQEQRNKIKNLTLQYQYAVEQQQILERLVKTGAASQKDLIDSKLKTQNLLTDLEDTKNQSLTTEKSISEALSKIDEAKTKSNVDIQSELAGVLLEIEKLKEQISANIDRVSRTEITAPVDGVVRSINYNTVGGIIKAGDTIAEIIPTNETLLIDAKVGPQDRGRIWIGQPVNIKLSAYDSSINGGLKGSIIEISADTFLDEGTRAPYYAVKIESNMKGFGAGKPIYPGMLAEIDLISGEHTVISYLLKPILKVFSDSLTEN